MTTMIRWLGAASVGMFLVLWALIAATSHLDGEE